MSKVKVLLCKIGEKPEAKVIESSLESLQAIVGGCIEYAFLQGSVDGKGSLGIICNEEGKIRGLPINRGLFNEGRTLCVDMIVGNFMVVKDDGGEDFVDITEEDIHAVKNRFTVAYRKDKV